MTLKLYFSPGACSLSPHIALEESGLSHEIDALDFKTRVTKSGEKYADVNPKGYVPALRLDDGEVLTEGPAILQFIADKAPEKKLAPPAGTIERYRLQELLNFIGTEIHKSFSPLFNSTTPDQTKALSKEKIGKRFAFLDEKLGAKPYLMGDTFTVADGYLFVMIMWAKKMQLDVPPKLAELFDRVKARPAVQTALKAEGLPN